jgi:hypothetical protein
MALIGMETEIHKLTFDHFNFIRTFRPKLFYKIGSFAERPKTYFSSGQFGVVQRFIADFQNVNCQNVDFPIVLVSY